MFPGVSAGRQSSWLRCGGVVDVLGPNRYSPLSKRLLTSGTRRSDTLISPQVMALLPKAELHLHLDGSVRPLTILELAKEQGVELPSTTEAGLKEHICVAEGCSSLEEYLVGFDITNKVLQKPYAITRAMYEVCEDAVADGIKYIEVRFGPDLHTAQGMSLSQVMEAACEGRIMAESNLPIVCRIIVCGIRCAPPVQIEKLAEMAWRYREKGVVAFDLAGPEFGFPAKDHQKAFEIIRNKHINCTIHAGEAAPPGSIKEAIRFNGAHRIGHGVTLPQDPGLMQYVADRGIAIETCITSNLHTKAIAKVEDHPMRTFLEQGIRVVPCVDNKTVSDISLTEEYLLYQRTFGLSVEEMVSILDHGFTSAFLPSTQKKRLRADSLRATVDILANNGYDVTSIFSGNAHWDRIGVDFSDKLSKRISPLAYWGMPEATQPRLSQDILNALPKSDLNCRLDGGVSFDHLATALSSEHIGFATSESLRTLYGSGRDGKEKVLKLANEALQTPDQLRAAVSNVVEGAARDNVRYMELSVRPTAHTMDGLSPRDVLESVLSQVKEVASGGPVCVGVNVHANVKREPSAVLVDSLADLAIANRGNGVVGFAVLGEDIQAANYKFYNSTFYKLKKANMNVSIFAGKSDADNITAALHSGGARRISGGFAVHNSPELMDYIANHGIPVELGITPLFHEHTTRLSTFAGHPVRLFLDHNMRVSLCSLKGMQRRSRSDALHQCVVEANLSVPETLTLVMNGFLGSYQHLEEKNRLSNEVWTETSNILSEAGYCHVFEKFYMLPHE